MILTSGYSSAGRDYAATQSPTVTAPRAEETFFLDYSVRNEKGSHSGETLQKSQCSRDTPLILLVLNPHPRNVFKLILVKEEVGVVMRRGGEKHQCEREVWTGCLPYESE